MKYQEALAGPMVCKGLQRKHFRVTAARGSVKFGTPLWTLRRFETKKGGRTWAGPAPLVVALLVEAPTPACGLLLVGFAQDQLLDLVLAGVVLDPGLGGVGHFLLVVLEHLGRHPTVFGSEAELLEGQHGRGLAEASRFGPVGAGQGLEDLL